MALRRKWLEIASLFTYVLKKLAKAVYAYPVIIDMVNRTKTSRML